VVVGAAANAAGGSLGEVLNNVDPNHPDAWYAGAGSAALSGAVFGGLGAAAAEAVFLKTTSRALRSAQSRRPPLSYQLWQEDDEGKVQATKLVQDKIFEIAQALSRSPVFNAVYALPGVFFVTVDTAFEACTCISPGNAKETPTALADFRHRKRKLGSLQRSRGRYTACQILQFRRYSGSDGGLQDSPGESDGVGVHRDPRIVLGRTVVVSPKITAVTSGSGAAR
jgi:hypothetical protein